MSELARAELRMLLRNKLVLSSAVMLPLFFAGMIYALRDLLGAGGPSAALQVISLATIGVYITATTTIASRRQTLFLKRVRATGTSGASLLTGLLAPVVALNLVQIALILAVTAAVQDPPAQIGWVVLGILLIEAVMVAWALATARTTRSPEHAQLTTTPLFMLFFIVAILVLTFESARTLWVGRALPGGAAVELVADAWAGDLPAARAAMLAAITLAWAAAGALAARGMSWEPRPAAG